MRTYLKHLRTFRALCRTGSMKRAGVEVRRAQSAVSHAVQELERALGAELFERDLRGTRLTEAGRRLEARLDLALAEMAAARAAMARAAGGPVPDAPVFSLSVSGRWLEVLAAFGLRQPMGEVARQLGISQPAISMAVRSLEASTGVGLFERGGLGIQLTQAGRLLALHARRALAELGVAEAEIAALKGAVVGTVRVGALPFGRAYILPAAIAGVVARHPLLRVVTVEAPYESLKSGVRAGEIDFLFGALQPTSGDGELVREELFEDRLAVVARAGHPLAARAALQLGVLRDAAWVLPRGGTPTRAAVDALFRGAGAEPPEAAVESSDLSIIRGLLLESDMVTAASRQLFHHELAAGLLVPLIAELSGGGRSIGLLRRAELHLSPGARLLMEAIRAQRGAVEPPDA